MKISLISNSVVKSAFFIIFLAMTNFAIAQSDGDQHKNIELEDDEGICKVAEADEEIISLSSIQESPSEVKELLGIDPSVSLSTECFPLPLHNYGVLVNNEHYFISRSAALGEYGYTNLKKHLESNNLPRPKTVIYMNHYGYKKSHESVSKFLNWIKPNDPTLQDFATQEDRIFTEEGIDFYHPLSLKDGHANVYLDGKNPTNPTELPFKVSDILNLDSMAYFRSKKVPWENRVLRGDKEAFYNVLEIILSGKGPIHFHCKGGLHRTGMIALAIRYLQGGHWTKNFPVPFSIKATTKYVLSETVEIVNLAEYEYSLHNRTMFRVENLLTLRELSKEPRFKELKMKYGPLLKKGNSCKKK